MTDAKALEGLLSSLDPDVVRCPYDYFERLRKESRVPWVEALGAFAVMEYADVLEVLRQPEVFSSHHSTGTLATQRMNLLAGELLEESEEMRRVLESSVVLGCPVLINADPPDHIRQRSLISRAFTPRRVQQLEPAIRQLSSDLIDKFVDRGTCEFVEEFAGPLPLVVIVRALGLPEADLPRLKEWSDACALTVGNHVLTKQQVAEVLKSLVELFSYFEEKVKEIRQQDDDGGVQQLIRAQSNGEQVSDAELSGILVQFLTAGNETSTKLLSSGLLFLLRDRELLARLRHDRSLIPGFIEEVLRLQAPLMTMFRSATHDTEIAGVTIPAGTDVWLNYAMANRDETQFIGADAMDVKRPNPQTHLAFGFGPHYCPGAPLGRLEARVAFEVLLERLGDMDLDVNNKFEYSESFMLHGLKELHITFSRGAR